METTRFRNFKPAKNIPYDYMKFFETNMKRKEEQAIELKSNLMKKKDSNSVHLALQMNDYSSASDDECKHIFTKSGAELQLPITETSALSSRIAKGALIKNKQFYK